MYQQIALTKEEIVIRLKEIQEEREDILRQRVRFSPTLEDVEDMSDAYQIYIEQGYALSDLGYEKEELIRQLNN